MKFYFFKNKTFTLILILFLQITKARFVSETNREQINRETQDYFHERGLTFGDPDSIYDQNDMDLENDGIQYFPQPPIYNTFPNANNQKPQLQLEPQLPKSNQIVQPLPPLQQLESELKLQQLIQQQKEYQQFQKQYARELQQKHLHAPQVNNGLFLHQNLAKNEQNLLYRSPKKVLSLLKQNEQSNLLDKLPVNPEYHKIYNQKFMIHQPAPPLEHQSQLQAQQPLIQNPEQKILINVDSDNKQLQSDPKDSYIPHDKKSLYTDPNSFDLEVFSEEKLNPAHSALYNSFNQPKENNNINLEGKKIYF